MQRANNRESSIVASEVVVSDTIIIYDTVEREEKVMFRAWSDAGNILLWTDSCHLNNPIHVDPSCVVVIRRRNGHDNDDVQGRVWSNTRPLGGHFEDAITACKTLGDLFEEDAIVEPEEHLSTHQINIARSAHGIAERITA